MSLPEEVAERLPILGQQSKDGQPVSDTAVYSRRWYILIVFCLGSFCQALVWNTWGPITESAEIVLDWQDSNIGMLANYGNIAFMITVLPMCYLVDVKGLRISLLICAFLVMAGTSIRCITLHPVPATWLANICAVLNGIGGSVPFAGPAALSSVWFPPDQRATATAIVSFANYLGVSLSFIIGPQMVSSPAYKTTNSTTHDNITDIAIRSPSIGMVHSMGTFHVVPVLNNIYAYSNHTHKELINKTNLITDIKNYLYFQAGLGVLFFLLVLIYFPARPPKPPSATAAIKRTEYMTGLSRLLCNGSVWLIVLAYALPTGILGVWQSVLDVNLKPLGISQNTAGYMGFWQTLAGCTAGLVIARFADIFMKRMKLFLITLFLGAVAASAWFFVLWEKFIPFNITSLYAACILIGILINGGIPLFYEIACEASYPVAEGVTGGFLTLINNIIGICFLFVMLIPNIGQSWMNEVLLASAVLALPLLFVFPERYRRTDLDITIDIDSKVGDLQASVKTIENEIDGV
ncbi:solute carrier family 49 member 4 homolog isoform X2 [Ruditapes philippinarum]|nr:solute carrier family 49 member 4 homolog isoform X2 [Ruditapes philippinarum]